MGVLSLLTAERRRFDRISCNLPAAISTPHVRCDGIAIRNLSEGGMRIELTDMRPGPFLALARFWRKFTVTFVLSHGAVRARARLAWSQLASADGRTSWCAGLEFVRMGARSRRRLDAHLKEQAREALIANYADPAEKNLRRVFTG